MKIKHILLFSLAWVTFACSNQPAQKPTAFILVRHAEKEIDGTKNPNLSSEGNERANQLANLLEQETVTALYATPYKRTEQTLQPLATSKGLTIRSYQPRDSAFLGTLFATNPSGIVVIAGHSNTIPDLVNQLIGENRFQQLEESDYNDLFIVTTSEIGKGDVIQLTY